MRGLVKFVICLLFLSVVASASAEEEANYPRYYVLKPSFITNVKSRGGGDAYAKISVSIMGRDSQTIHDLRANDPMIRNALIMLFTDKYRSHLQTAKGREALREEAQEVVQEVLINEGITGRIDRVLFIHFIVE